jgi:hypothetical protein
MMRRPTTASFIAGLLLLVAAAVMDAAPQEQTFTGVIIDDSCAGVGHSRMQMGPTDAECARACVSEHGVPYVLEDGARTYSLSDQKFADQFAAQRVHVVGVLAADGKTITVQSIAPQHR